MIKTPRSLSVCFLHIYDIFFNSHNFRLPKASFPVIETHQCPDCSGFDTGRVLLGLAFPIVQRKSRSVYLTGRHIKPVKYISNVICTDIIHFQFIFLFCRNHNVEFKTMQISKYKLHASRNLVYLNV